MIEKRAVPYFADAPIVILIECTRTQIVGKEVYLSDVGYDEFIFLILLYNYYAIEKRKKKKKKAFAVDAAVLCPLSSKEVAGPPQ